MGGAPTGRGLPGAGPGDDRLGDLTDVVTAVALAERLRWLRRRQARERTDPPLTYRELGARTGWAYSTVGLYLSGKVLPPTDRFDVLTDLLGAAPAERSALAAARDRVEERQR